MNIKKYSWMAVLPLFLSACQEDTLVGNDIQQQGIYTLSGKMSAGSSLSRAQIDLSNTDGSKETAFWNEGDAIGIFQKKNGTISENVFTISSEYKEATAEDKGTAIFTTETPAVADKYVAVYPAGKTFEGNSMSLSFDTFVTFSAAMPNIAVWEEYFKRNMYMMATGTFDDAENASVEFHHLCALARITYTNKSGREQAISRFYLGAQSLCDRVNCNLEEGKADMAGASNALQLNTNNLVVADGESTDLYMLFFPSEFGEEDFTIEIVDNNDNGKVVRVPIETIKDANPDATGFEAGKRYWFKVTQTKYNLVMSKEYSEAPVTIPNVELSQALLEMLGSEVVSIDETTNYAVMKECDINEVMSLTFNDNYDIASFVGIEKFKNLKALHCMDQKSLVALDLSECSNLSNITVSGCTNLTDLRLGDKARIIALDYSHSGVTIPTEEWAEFTSLISLGCAGRFEGELNIDAAVKGRLTRLVCQNNQLTSLDLEQYPNLEYLECYANKLTELDLTAASKLKNLRCFSNKIETLDITSLENLVELDCGNQNENTTRLTLIATEAQQETWRTSWINSFFNENVDLVGKGEVILRNVELSAALQEKYPDDITIVNGYAIMTQDYANKVEELSFSAQSITSLAGIEIFKNLKKLTCVRANLSECDLSQNKALTMLNLSTNLLSSIDLSENLALTNLILKGNLLTEIDLTNNINLTSLSVSGNQIEILDVKTLSELSDLNCGGQNIQGKLILHLTEAQKELWINTWENNGNNQNVELYELKVDEGTGSTGGDNFNGVIL